MHPRRCDERREISQPRRSGLRTLASAILGLCIFRADECRRDCLDSSFFDRSLSEDAAHFHVVGEYQTTITDAFNQDVGDPEARDGCRFIVSADG